MTDARAARIATNEVRFREINERLERDLVGLLDEPGELVGFVCECGHGDCTAPVHLSVAEYERVRADPRQFAVVPGHELGDVEDVIERHTRFAIVRKHRPTWPIVARDG